MSSYEPDFTSRENSVQNLDLFIDRVIDIPWVVIETTISKLVRGILQTAVFTPLSIVTLGLNKTININAGVDSKRNWLYNVTPNLLVHVLKIVNKDAKIPKFQHSTFSVESTEYHKTMFSRKGKRYVHLISAVITSQVKLVSMVALRIALLVPGAFALIAAIATRGKFEEINQIAINLFNPLGIVSDICRGVRAIINPLQFEKSYYNERSDPLNHNSPLDEMIY